MRNNLGRWLAFCAGLALPAAPAAAQLHPWCHDLVQLDAAAAGQPPFSSLPEARLRDLLGFRDCTPEEGTISCTRPGSLDDPMVGTAIDAIRLCLRAEREVASGASVRLSAQRMEFRFTAAGAGEDRAVTLRVQAHP